MCKKANGLYLFLIIWYVASSLAIGMAVSIFHIQLPMELGLTQVYILMIPPLLVYMAINKINPGKHFAFKVLKPVDVLLCILFGYMLVPMMLALSQFTTLLVENHLDNASTQIFQTFSFGEQLFFMALIPAVAEELVFRGFLYHSYRKNGVFGAAVISALGFGLFHLNLNQFLYAFVLGIVFALLVEATSSLFSSMLAHFAANSYSVIIMNVLPREMIEEANNQPKPGLLEHLVSIMVLVVFAAMFCTIAYLIFCKLAKRNNRLLYMAEKISQGMKPQNGEKFVTLSLWLAIIFAALVMFWIDFGSRLVYNQL